MALIILSARYIDAEMRMEFGKIPPCMLPLQGRRLLAHQIENFSSEQVILALPECYEIKSGESRFIERNHIQICRAADNMNLGSTINCALSDVDAEEEITIIFGDTLVNTKKSTKNIIGITKSSGYYEWSQYCQEQNIFKENTTVDINAKILCGYLNFSDKQNLLLSLRKTSFDFIPAINNLLDSKKCIVEEVSGWFDLGHIRTYFETRKYYTTEREFNNIYIDDDYLVKTSRNHLKIDCEGMWFEDLPTTLKHYVPVTVRDSSRNAYAIEYMNHLTLSELFVFCDLSDNTWTDILNSCFIFIEKCSHHNKKCVNENWNMISKLSERWSELPEKLLYQYDRILKLNDLSIQDLMQDIQSNFEDENTLQIIHGDFCFSNIMYNFRSTRVVLLDPRGCDFSGTYSLYGPIGYDIAKLGHSIIGRYDEIVYDMYEINNNGELCFDENKNYQFVKEIYLNKVAQKGINLKVLYAEIISLFLSMLPLHSDSPKRQHGLFLNSLRLYKDYRAL